MKKYVVQVIVRKYDVDENNIVRDSILLAEVQREVQQDFVYSLLKKLLAFPAPSFPLSPPPPQQRSREQTETAG